MRRRITTAVCALLVAGTAPLTAQITAYSSDTNIRSASSVEGGGFLEFIHKLSGPQFDGLMFTITCGFNCRLTTPFPRELNRHVPLRWRLTYGAMKDDEYVSDPPVVDTSSLTMKVFELGLEAPVAVIANRALIDLGAGVSYLRFGGDADGFSHWSFPLRAQLRVPVAIFTFRLGGGIRFFPPFDSDAFQPATVTGLKTSVEAPLFWFAGIEVHR